MFGWQHHQCGSYPTRNATDPVRKYLLERLGIGAMSFGKTEGDSLGSLLKEGKVERLVFEDRKQWRRWLRINHNRRSEVWLILPKKSAGGNSYRTYYNQALEEALCYGWIDSRIKPLDATRSMVRFSPRKSNNWSRLNIARALQLIRTGKMTKAGLKVLPQGLISKAR